MYLSMGMEIQDDEQHREKDEGSNDAKKLEALQPRRFSSFPPFSLRRTWTHFSLQSATLQYDNCKHAGATGLFVTKSQKTRSSAALGNQNNNFE